TTSGEYFGMGRAQLHLITLPAGATVKWMRIQGHARFDMDSFPDASLVELNDETCLEGRYVLPKGSMDASFDIPFPGGLKNNLTMKWTGNNPWLKIFLHTTDDYDEANGIQTIFPSDREDIWYNMEGMRIKSPTLAGLYIHNGKKVIIK
ncbi:MAG: hypothetical protein K2L00_02025, partial [Muribaculaceae bacterium]|nr:hypothetical protein [Muribaculaceae bacterium]